MGVESAPSHRYHRILSSEVRALPGDRPLELEGRCAGAANTNVLQEAFPISHCQLQNSCLPPARVPSSFLSLRIPWSFIVLRNRDMLFLQITHFPKHVKVCVLVHSRGKNTSKWVACKQQKLISHSSGARGGGQGSGAGRSAV